jgi:hypothetical protein
MEWFDVLHDPDLALYPEARSLTGSTRRLFGIEVDDTLRVTVVEDEVVYGVGVHSEEAVSLPNKTLTHDYSR